MGLLLFYAAATLTLFASFGVVATRNIVHAALFLLAALGGVAGLFVLLYAEFLALVQLLIYGGAVTIVILFALMLTRSGEYEGETETRRRPFAALAAAVLFGLMTAVFVADAGRVQHQHTGGSALRNARERPLRGVGRAVRDCVAGAPRRAHRGGGDRSCGA